MKKYVTFEEIEVLCEALIKSFLKKMYYRDILCVDIESFVTQFLGLPLTYESIREEDEGRIGFFSDGECPIRIVRDGIRQEVTFEENTVVIEKCLTLPKEAGKKRFTIAHEGSHFILKKHFSIQTQAAFHSEFDSDLPYTQEMIEESMNLNEMLANRAAACLLMPKFLLEKAFKKYNGGKPIRLYGQHIISMKDRIAMRNIADAMGVSYAALYYRLKELKLFDMRSVDEYADTFCAMGGEAHG